MRDEAIRHIFSISSLPNAMDMIEQHYLAMTKQQTLDFNLEVGAIPEIFNHDSSEEKLWSKLSDVVLAKCLSLIGLESSVIKARADSADVIAHSDNYSMVADAKAFRLSRTAKNQKDFKVEALSGWRGDNDYALLVCPIYQYPSRSSQIYKQAITKNVCLLSYVHINYMIENYTDQDFSLLWNASSSVTGNIDQKDCANYWNKIDFVMCSILGKNINEFNDYKKKEFDKAQEIAGDEINYWQSVKNGYLEYTKEEAVTALIKASKIDEKIATITKSILGND